MKTKKILILPLIVMYVLFVQLVLKIYSADVAAAGSEKALNRGSMQTSLAKANESLEKNPYEPAYYRQRAKVLLTYTLTSTDEEKDKIKNLALQDLETAYILNPYNIATLRNSAALYMILATEDLAKPSGPNNIDDDYTETTRIYFRNLKESFPSDVGVHVLTAKLEKRLGFAEEYENSVKRIKELRPDLLEWHPDLIN